MKTGTQWFIAITFIFLIAASLSLAETRINGVIELFEVDKPALGVFVHDFSNVNAARLADSNLDFIFIDMEHGPFDVETLRIFLQSMISRRELHASGGQLQPRVLPIVRIPQNGREQLQFIIKQVLDTGVYGVLAPHISSREDALAAVRAARYPQLANSSDTNPPGLRGVAPSVAARYWGLHYLDYMKRADPWPLDPEGELLVIAQIENEEGVSNIDEIARVPGIGAIFIGPSDLAVSLGLSPADSSPELSQAIDTVLKSCRRFEIPCGITTSQGEIEQRLQEGYLMLTIGSDGGLSGATTEMLRRYKADR